MMQQETDDAEHVLRAIVGKFLDQRPALKEAIERGDPRARERISRLREMLAQGLEERGYEGISEMVFPIQTLVDDLKEQRKAAIQALRQGPAPGKFDLDMDLIREIAALHGAIVAVEAQREEDSDWPPDGVVEPESYADD